MSSMHYLLLSSPTERQLLKYDFSGELDICIGWWMSVWGKNYNEPFQRLTCGVTWKSKEPEVLI